MSRSSRERRAHERANANERRLALQRRVLGRWAASAPKEPLQRAQYFASHEILEEAGLSAVGVRDVGLNCAGFTNTVLAPKAHRPGCACASGCAWCCVLEVSAWPAEVIQLAARLEAGQTPSQRTSLLARLREAVALADGERSAGRQPRVACPLLMPDRTCSVHEARPSACAAVFSVDAARCQAYAEGTEHADKDRIGLILTLLAPAQVAAHVIMQHGGPPTDGSGASVDLHAGLAAALEMGAEAAATAWIAGEDVFREARERSRLRAASTADGGPQAAPAPSGLVTLGRSFQPR